MRRAMIYAAALFASCGPRVERQSAEVNVEGWTESVEWRYENRDTTSVKQLALEFDYTDAALLTGDTFVVEVDFPRTGRFETAISPVSDTVELRRVVFASRAPFDQPGRYVFRLTPLGRTVGVSRVTLELRDGQRAGTPATGKSDGKL